MPLALLRLQGTPWKARHLRGWSRGVRSATRRPARPLATRLLCLRRHLGRVQAQGQRQRQCQGQRQTRGQGHARPCLRPCLAHGQRLARLCQCLGQRQCQGQRRARGQGLARPCLRPCLAHGQRLGQPWPAMAGTTLPFSPARPRQRMTWRVWFRRRQWEKARRLCRSGPELVRSRCAECRLRTCDCPDDVAAAPSHPWARRRSVLARPESRCGRNHLYCLCADRACGTRWHLLIGDGSLDGIQWPDEVGRP